MMCRFHAVYDKLNQALDDLPYDELGVPIEVKEQVIFHLPLCINLSQNLLPFHIFMFG